MQKTSQRVSDGKLRNIWYIRLTLLHQTNTCFGRRSHFQPFDEIYKIAGPFHRNKRHIFFEVEFIDCLKYDLKL